MDCTATRINYQETGAFSKLMIDYLSRNPALAPFYAYPVNWKGFEAAIQKRQSLPIDRESLYQHLQQQYQGLELTEQVRQNIEKLRQSNSYTVVTAHQPNLFTGPLYFIYKIAHAIKLAATAAEKFPDLHFVPVYYMGNEDADLDELGHFHLRGEKIEWQTDQTGAVGRMKVDAALLKLIDRAEGEIAVLPHGSSLIAALRQFYLKGETIQNATLKLVNHLFGTYGLLVMVADSAILKQQMIPLFEKELTGHSASVLVESTAEKLAAAGYKVQAHPRDINLFYLADGIRNRIVREGDDYIVHQTDIRFSQTEMLAELKQHPERFSPNVILRGIYQESILPNLAFVGGGGETAYWLQLKSLFEQHQVSFPMLVVRNSFLLMEKRQSAQLQKMGLTFADIFNDEEKILQKLAQSQNPSLASVGEKQDEVATIYDQLKVQAVQIDASLGAHVEALQTRAVKKLQELQKKMLRAEKRKLTDERGQINQIRNRLFPKGGLQERTESFMLFYAANGQDWVEMVYQNSLALEQQFVIVECGN